MAVVCPRLYVPQPEYRELPSLDAKAAWPCFAIRVRGRSEALVSESLSKKGYGCFSPTYLSRKRWSDRTKVQELPLFPGYIFCRLDLCNRLPILVTPGVIGIAGAGKTPLPVKDSEIEAI